MLEVEPILDAAFIPVDAVRAVCPRIDPATVRVRPAPWWLRSINGREVSGVALPWGIYLWPDALDESSPVRAALLCHELVHVDQWREHGVFGFVRRYTGDYVRERIRGESHHAAYRHIGLERDAVSRTRKILLRRM